jgi:NAD(P)-dependent dehydrogenase (short-subunit alcohol dehydrogenase family)
MGVLDGKVAIVTGAGRGVGRGEALLLAQVGAKVVVNDFGGSVAGEGSDERPASEVVEVIRSRGAEATADFEDVSDFAASEKIISHALDTYGRLDVIVNNAGILRDRMIFSMSEEDFDSVIRVHLKGTWNMMHHGAVHWRQLAKDSGPARASIINTVSSAGLLGQAGQSNYGAAKAGIAALTVIGSLELGRYGIRVNAITPGGSTRIVGQANKQLEVKEADEYTGFDPMNPGNSAPMVAWLASDEAAHVTGQVFRAIGNTIARYTPWVLGEGVQALDGAGSPVQWDPQDIGPAVNGEIFGSRALGLQLRR